MKFPSRESLLWLRFDDRCEAQHARIDPQPGLPGRLDIDFEATMPINQPEVNDPALTCKPVHLAHGENSRCAKFRENSPQVLPLRRTDEQNLAIAPLDGAGDIAHNQGPAQDGLAANCIPQGAPERVLTEYANTYRGLSRFKSLGGPFNKFSEVVKECRLDLIFADSLGGSTTRGDKDKKQAVNTSRPHIPVRMFRCQKRHAIFATTAREVSIGVTCRASRNSMYRGVSKFCPVMLISTNWPICKPNLVSSRV